MEGSRVFVCELQQLLNSIRELEIGKGVHYKLDSHVETLYSTLNSSKSSSCAPKQGEQILSLSDTVDTIALEQELAKALTALNDAKTREFAAEDRMAQKDKMLEEAAAEKQERNYLIYWYKITTTDAAYLLQLLADQVSCTCAQVEKLTERLHAMGEMVRNTLVYECIYKYANMLVY